MPLNSENFKGEQVVISLIKRKAILENHRGPKMVIHSPGGIWSLSCTNEVGRASKRD
jgi:hypothetical protein